MTLPKKLWNSSLFMAALLSLFISAPAKAGGGEGDEWVKKSLTPHYIDFGSYVRETIKGHEPISKVNKAIDEKLREDEDKDRAHHHADFSVEDHQFFVKAWSEAEKEQENPLLKAVCLHQQYIHSREQAQKLELLGSFVDQLCAASKHYKADPVRSFQLEFFAAWEANRISEIYSAIGFIFPTEEKAKAQFSSLIMKPALLWTSLAKSDRIDSDVLYRLIREPLPGELQNPDLNLLANWGINEIPDPFKDRENAKVKKLIKWAFKAQCLYRAYTYRMWHFKAAMNGVHSLPRIGSEDKEVEKIIKDSKKMANYVAKLAHKLKVPSSTFRLALLAGELRSYPFRQFLEYGKLGAKAKKVLDDKRDYAWSFLKEMYTKTLENSGSVSEKWVDRNKMVRAHYGLAMLESDKAKRLERLRIALGLSRLNEGENPNVISTINMNGDIAVYKYDHGDLHVGLKFPTWEQALTFYIQELEKEMNPDSSPE